MPQYHESVSSCISLNKFQQCISPNVLERHCWLYVYTLERSLAMVSNKKGKSPLLKVQPVCFFPAQFSRKQRYCTLYNYKNIVKTLLRRQEQHFVFTHNQSLHPNHISPLYASQNSTENPIGFHKVVNNAFHSIHNTTV